MGYQVVDPDEQEPLAGRSAEARSITDVAGLERLGIRVYEAVPGEQLPLGYHYHERQEEAFHVIRGELHVETPGRTYVASAGEVFVAEPDSPHRAHNPESADESVRVFAVGAPTGDDGIPYEDK